MFGLAMFGISRVLPEFLVSTKSARAFHVKLEANASSLSARPDRHLPSGATQYIESSHEVFRLHSQMLGDGILGASSDGPQCRVRWPNPPRWNLCCCCFPQLRPE